MLLEKDCDYQYCDIADQLNTAVKEAETKTGKVADVHFNGDTDWILDQGAMKLNKLSAFLKNKSKLLSSTTNRFYGRLATQ